MVFNCPSEGDSGSEAGVTHWEYALRAWFAFVHASPPTGVTKKSPYGLLPIPAFPKSGKAQNPIPVQGLLNHVPHCSAVQNDEKKDSLAGYSPSQHFPSQIKKFPLTGTFLSSKILFLISFSLKIQGHQVS